MLFHNFTSLLNLKPGCIPYKHNPFTPKTALWVLHKVRTQVSLIPRDVGRGNPNHMTPVLCRGLRGTFFCVLIDPHSTDPPAQKRYYSLALTFPIISAA